MREYINLIEAAQANPLNDAFWRWFGDSKIVSPDGNPLVVYHGSNSHAYIGGEIDIFHTLPVSGRGAAFFSSSKELAGEYGVKVYSVYLRIENPLIVHGDGKRWTMLDGKTRIGGRITDPLRIHHQKRAKEWADLLSDFTEWDEGERQVFEPKSKIPDDAHELDGFGLELVTDEDASTDEIVKRARKLGYDGVIFKDIIDSPTSDSHLYRNVPADVYAVFKANQIKSVNNSGNWDNNDPDITA